MLLSKGLLGKIETFHALPGLFLLIAVSDLILLVFLIAILVSLKKTREEVMNLKDDISRIKADCEKKAGEEEVNKAAMPSVSKADKEDQGVYDEIMSFSRKSDSHKEKKAESVTEEKTEPVSEEKPDSVTEETYPVSEEKSDSVTEETHPVAEEKSEPESASDDDLDYALSHMEAGPLKVADFFKKMERDKDYPATILACRLRGISAAEYYLKMRNIFTREAVWLTPAEDKLILAFIKNDKNRVMEFVWKHIVYQEEVSAYKLFDVSDDHGPLEAEKEAEEFLN